MKHSATGLMLITVTALLLAACTTSATKFPVQRYVPVGRAQEPLGELDLSNTLMRFSALEGEMKLKYVGHMPDSAGEDLAGATVYSVKNWQAYFKRNSGHEAYCASAPRWVAVNSKAGAPAWSNEISVSLLTLEEWEKFRPIAHRSCAGGTYVRTQG